MRRFKKGQRYRSLRDVEVLGLVSFKNPSSGGFNATLPGGEIVVLESNPAKTATAVYATPIRYAVLETQLVPPSDLADPAYGFYSLVVPLDKLATDFEAVGDA